MSEHSWYRSQSLRLLSNFSGLKPDNCNCTVLNVLWRRSLILLLSNELRFTTCFLFHEINIDLVIHVLRKGYRMRSVRVHFKVSPKFITFAERVTSKLAVDTSIFYFYIESVLPNKEPLLRRTTRPHEEPSAILRKTTLSTLHFHFDFSPFNYFCQVCTTSRESLSTHIFIAQRISCFTSRLPDRNLHD